MFVCLVIGKGTEVKDSVGTSLQVALMKGNVKTAELLLANGADCKVSNGYGETVLHLLCKDGVDSHELCEDLISRAVSPHLADKEGNLPLHIALKNKLPKTSYLLFKQLVGSTLDGVQEINILEKDMNSLLSFAVYSCDADSCQKLLDLGANPNSPNTINCVLRHGCLRFQPRRMHPLHTAVVMNNSELCRLLLDHGATVNSQMYTLNSTFHLAQPLHLAVQLGFIDVCRLLMERGALINAEMEEGETPLHLAVVQNRDDIARLLLCHGGIAENVPREIAADGEVLRLSYSGSEDPVVETPVMIGMPRAMSHDSGGHSGPVSLSIHSSLTLLSLIEEFPDKIVSQGEGLLQVTLSLCSEETAERPVIRGMQRAMLLLHDSGGHSGPVSCA